MKNSLTIKTTIAMSIFSITLISLFASKLFQNFDVVSDAKNRINLTLEEKDKPYIINLEYKINPGEVVITKKTHYSQYRKKPDYEQHILKTNNCLNQDIDTTIKFTYNRKDDPDNITQINKPIKKSIPKFKKIALHQKNNTSEILKLHNI
ncbi:hypothetical protein GF322_00220 [Candidatus Dependentiae bacterium]|nr:hypothetical protein [Candidatus Dependentiae bacterium]